MWPESGKIGWKCQKNLKALHVNLGYGGLQTPSLHGSRRWGHVLNPGGQPLGNGAEPVAPGALEVGAQSVPKHCSPEPGAPERCLIFRCFTLLAVKQSWGKEERGSKRGQQPKQVGTLPGEMRKPGSMPEVTSRVQGTKKESRRNWLKSQKAPMESKFLIGTTLE